MAVRWYAVHTYSGQEGRVFEQVSDLIATQEFAGRINQTLMPTQEVVQVKGGKKVKTTRKFFPSYILIEMELDRDTMHRILDIGGVTGFVGGKKPQPLREEEVRRILGQHEKEEQQEISEIPFQIGDSVKIKEGPFKDFDGVVDEIHPEKGKIKVMVSVFGRSTPVEVDFVHVTPIS
jgi:transcriptional antiterminator NusG